MSNSECLDHVRRVMQGEMDGTLNIGELIDMFDVSFEQAYNSLIIARFGEYHWIPTHEDKELRTVMQENARAHRLGLSTSISLPEWIAIKARAGNKCKICGCDKPLTMDHIIALSMDGTHTVDNIQPLCKPCNSRKGGSNRAANGRKSA